MSTSHGRPANVKSVSWRQNLTACTRPFGRGVLTAIIAGATLFSAAPASAAADLKVAVITWDVIGLDSNKPSTDGPTTFPLAVRIRNQSLTDPAINVQVELDLDDTGNMNISTFGPTILPDPQVGEAAISIPPDSAKDFYFLIEIKRPPGNNNNQTDGYFSVIGEADTVRGYEVKVTADGGIAISTEDDTPDRQLFVQKILSQSRNSVISLTYDYPEIPFLAGQIRTFSLVSDTATGYDQQETTVNFPTDIFRIQSVKTVYDEPACGCISNPKPLVLVDKSLTSTPGKFTTNKIYVDGCGWVTDPGQPGYMSTNNFCTATANDNESPTGKIGGMIVTTYKVLVVKNMDRDVSLSWLVHDHSGGSFHYGFDANVLDLRMTNVMVEKTPLENPVEAGEEFSYIITVCNTSGLAADDVVLTDSLPLCAKFADADPAPVNAAADPLRWELGTLAPMECVDIIVTATATCDTGECENIATVATSGFETNYDDNEDDAVINIVDTEPPSIDCPPDQDIDCDESSEPANTGEATADDLCGIDSISKSDVSMPLCGNTEVTTRTWTATDNNGNQSSCTQIITSFDTDAPDLSGIPADVTVECDDIPDTATVTATDNCDPSVPVTVDEGRTNGSCPSNYTIVRTWTAIDGCANETSASQSITVQDKTDPDLSAIPVDVTVECDDIPDTATVTATDNCDPSVPVTVDEVRTNGNCPSNYTLVRTWTAEDDCGNDISESQTITVRDTTDPDLSTIPADVTVECDDIPDTATVTATDNCDPSVPVTVDEVRTNGSCPSNYTIVRTWTAEDDCGNDISESQTITVRDTTDPDLSAIPADVTVECDNIPDTATVTATDNCDPSVPVTVDEVRTNGNCPSNYTLVRTWTAEDDCGNDISESQTITVRDTTPPVLDCPDNITKPGPTGADTCVVVDYSATAEDNCDDDVSISFDPPSGTCFDCGTVTEVEVTATDNCGNETSCTFTVTVGDCPRDGCSLTQGYWKNHPENWPLQIIKLGDRNYSKAECLKILNQPVQKNGLIALAHQLIAAKLNIASSAPNSCITATITAADALIGNKVVPPIGNGHIPTKQASDLNNKLDDYNNGRMCSTHCDDTEPSPVTLQL